MKRKLLLLSALLFALYTESSARGIPIPFCSECEYITPVADLPDSAQFYSEEYKAFADIAYVYKQVWVLWVPLWNFDEHYALSVTGQDVYFDISADELEKYNKAYNLDLPSNPVPLWDKIGGKAIVLLLVAAIVWGYWGGDKKEEIEEKEPAKEEEKEVVR